MAVQPAGGAFQPGPPPSGPPSAFAAPPPTTQPVAAAPPAAAQAPPQAALTPAAQGLQDTFDRVLAACRKGQATGLSNKVDQVSTKLHNFFAQIGHGLDERIEGELQQLAANLLAGQHAAAMSQVTGLIRGGDGTGVVGTGLLAVKNLAGLVKTFTSKERWPQL
jgi:hypothetical protein